MITNKSLFVVFEGMDGAGKTTLIEEIKNNQEVLNYLKKDFEKVIFLQEPGTVNKELHNQIRGLIFSEEFNLNHKTRALLFFVTRSEQMEKTIIPHLAQNTLILCDRFFLSTLVYQVGMSHLNENLIYEINKFVTEDITPHITFYIEITKEEYLKRIEHKINENAANSFDKMFKNYDNLVNNYEEYLKKYNSKLGKIIRLNGCKKPLDLAEEVAEKINEYLE